MTRVLVPVEVLAGESISSGLIDLLAPVDVVVLGYHVLPEQTPPDQARLQYEDRATDVLEDIAAAFREAGGTVETRLVFTNDRETTISRVASETGARAYVVRGPTGPVERLLVPLSGEVATDRILSFVEALVADREIAVTLFVATAEPTDEARLGLQAAADRLAAAGLTVSTELTVAEGLDALVEAAGDHDAIVLGERAPSISAFLFGDYAERVASESVGPVLVVRGETPGVDWLSRLRAGPP